MLDTEEHPERDRYLHEQHQRHGQHAHARLLVHLALLECDTLYNKLVPGSLVCPYLVEHLLELNKVQLVQSLRRLVRARQSYGSCLMGNASSNRRQAQEERACEGGVEAGQTHRGIDEHKNQQEQAGGEEGACDGGVESGQTRRGIDELEHSRGQAAGGPNSKPQRSEVTIFEARECRRVTGRQIRLGFEGELVRQCWCE